MSFSVAWLAQREPYDHAARHHGFGEALAAQLAAHEAPHVVELAGGTGSGVRWLQRHLPQARFTLVDHDPALLDAVPQTLATLVAHDLRDLRALAMPAQAVTCQALLDLVDLDFLTQLADWVAHDLGGVPLLAALTVDGRVTWAPHDPWDDAIQGAFRLHQLGDRGFGASVGTFAAPILADLLRVRGYQAQLVHADWQIPSSDSAMLTAMVEGTAHAAAEVHPDGASVQAWADRRRAQIASGTLSLTVGHTDLWAHALSAATP